ncbi:MAG: hypothetical protein MPK62_07295 [Alphaproteobacteria bacterium]|nr:hypothetical protein [Alphaproteobacteria bacterium]
MNNLTLNFPVLKKDGNDFLPEVSYAVGARCPSNQLQITHTLKGQSFIRELIEQGNAKFSVLLLYRNSSERQHHWCDAVEYANDVATSTKTIEIEGFSYAPEIIPSIVLLQESRFVVSATSGLTDFWPLGDSFDIPAHSRIALAPKLHFESGGVSHLFRVIRDDSLLSGEMRVEVNEDAGEGDTPVALRCAKDVCHELYKVTQASPLTPSESMRSAIITEALSATYAYMKNVHAKDSGYEERGVLRAHLEELHSSHGLDWGNEEFNPSLAATKMQPYAVSVLNGESDDDD